MKIRYSYRFLSAPGTIGAITWLARNEEHSQRIKHGLIISMVGTPAAQPTRKADAAVPRQIGRLSTPFVTSD
jgi:aminopeptidase-like protein